MREPYPISAKHGTAQAWAMDCSKCGGRVYLGRGALAAIRRLIATTPNPLCDPCAEEDSDA